MFGLDDEWKEALASYDIENQQRATTRFEKAFKGPPSTEDSPDEEETFSFALDYYTRDARKTLSKNKQNLLSASVGTGAVLGSRVWKWFRSWRGQGDQLQKIQTPQTFGSNSLTRRYRMAPTKRKAYGSASRKQTKAKKLVNAARAIARAANGGAMQISSGGSGGGGGFPTGFNIGSRGTPSSRQSELKLMDIFPANYAANSTGVFLALNTPTVGTSIYNRVGNEIEMKSLHVTGQIQTTSFVTTGASEYIRLMVVYDRQPNGTFPSNSDLLTDYNNGGNFTNSFSGLNPNNLDRFKVLMDQRFCCSDNSSTKSTVPVPSTDPQSSNAIDYTTNPVNINRYINLKGLCTRYKASTNPTGAIGDIASGALLMFILGNVAAGVEGFNYALKFRLRYVD